MTDAELVARAREGDDSAFGELVDRHRAAVFRAALAVLGSHADADDVAQDVFVLAHRRLASFRGEAAVRTWLLRIAWNQAVNRRRSVVRMVRRWVALDGSGPGDDAGERWAGNGQTPEAAAVDAELRRAIVEEVKRLSARLRDTLLLAQSGEYSYEEIAAMTGAPIGTVKWRVSEARRVVRNRLKARGHGNV